MKIKKKSLLNVYVIIFMFYVFFNLIFKVQSYAIWGLSMILICLDLVSKKRFKINGKDFLFIIFPIIMFLSSFFSPMAGSAIKFSVTFLLLTITLILLSKESKENIDNRFIFYVVLVFSGVHVIATLFYQLFPSIWQNILPYFLKGSDLRQNITTFNIQHINCGLSPIQSANAMYITAFITCAFIGSLKINKKYYIFLMIGLIALMLSGKRGVLLAVVFSILIVYMIFQYKEKRHISSSMIKIIFLIIVITCVGYFIARNYFPDSLRIIERFTKQKDITTGRLEYYKILLESYSNGHLITGNGLFFSRYKLLSVFGEANDAHNIYIQVLVELGIVGIISFFSIIFMTLKKLISYKRYNNITILMALFYTIVFLIYGMTGNDLFDLSILPFWYFLISFTLSREEDEKDEKDRNYNIS